MNSFEFRHLRCRVAYISNWFDTFATESYIFLGVTAPSGLSCMHFQVFRHLRYRIAYIYERFGTFGAEPYIFYMFRHIMGQVAYISKCNLAPATTMTCDKWLDTIIFSIIILIFQEYLILHRKIVLLTPRLLQCSLLMQSFSLNWCKLYFWHPSRSNAPFSINSRFIIDANCSLGFNSTNGINVKWFSPGFPFGVFRCRSDIFLSVSAPSEPNRKYF